MNNGITVESSDRFKSLIDKIATLADNEGKGIQYAEGSGSITFKSTTVDGYLAYQTFQIAMLDFTPNMVFVEFNAFSNVPGFIILSTNCTQDSPHILEYSSVNSYSHKIYLTVNGGSISVSVLTPTNSNTTATLNYYAIGVGEEDTTLRDSLADILENKGVDVTEEDDMASLITKVDEKLDELIIKEESRMTGTLPTYTPIVACQQDIESLSGNANTHSLIYSYTVNYPEFDSPHSTCRIVLKGQSGGMSCYITIVRDGNVVYTSPTYGADGVGTTSPADVFGWTTNVQHNDVINIYLKSYSWGWITNLRIFYYLI
jgi:hypothetical protein